MFVSVCHENGEAINGKWLRNRKSEWNIICLQLRNTPIFDTLSSCGWMWEQDKTREEDVWRRIRLSASQPSKPSMAFGLEASPHHHLWGDTDEEVSAPETAAQWMVHQMNCIRLHARVWCDVTFHTLADGCLHFHRILFNFDILNNLETRSAEHKRIEKNWDWRYQLERVSRNEIIIFINSERS